MYRKVHDGVVEAMRRRMRSAPEVYKRRNPTVEKSFESIKPSIRCENLLLTGLKKRRVERSIAGLCYNIKRAIAILGAEELVEALSGDLFARKSAHFGQPSACRRELRRRANETVSGILGFYRILHVA